MTNDHIEHYGVPRRSGRYPWGSGERPYQGDPKKAKLMKKYEKIEGKATRKRDSMINWGANPEKITDHVWRSNNKLDEITRKLLRLEMREVAKEAGIADKKLADIAADYEWGKRMAKQYASEGRLASKPDTKKLTDDVVFWTVLGGPITGVVSSVVDLTIDKDNYTLKGADYYEKVAGMADAIWKMKVPNASQDMLKMLEDKKG